jgi:hypothetical protein
MEDPSPASDVPSQNEGAGEPAVTGRWAGRRLADAINEVLQLALYRGDIKTATELLAVMEHVHERSQARVRYENRHADPLIELARRELQSKSATRRRS